MSELGFRQIHLDFHTSEAISAVGAQFDADEFADTLVRAHVNSINLFARCHHGWVYYDTPGFAERRHPQLTRDLLREQILACRTRGIKTPLYVTVQWDHYTASRHPEWCVIGADGRLSGTPPYEAGFYRLLCLNTPYVDWLKRFVQDMIDTLPPIDGFWFDIVDARDCSCWYCKNGMIEQGLEPSNAQDRRRYAEHVLRQFQRDMSAFVRARVPNALIFYNAGHVGPRHRPLIDAYTHLELESLPSGGWGYLHFPIAARYARTLGVDYVGMTGKFQTSWGDFHSFKNRAALEFECMHMLALNAKCCVGDQLLPHGKICADTYRLIGDVYAQVQAKEEWCTSATPLTEIGVLTPEEFDPAIERHRVDFKPIMGATRMLQEGVADGARYQFDILDSQSDFGRYRVLILPDKIPVEGALKERLEAYLQNGGALIASFASGMDAAQTHFALDLGVTLSGEGARDLQGNLVRGREYPGNAYVDYLVPRADLRAAFDRGIPHTEHTMYMRGMQIAAEANAEVLADVVAPYFDRTYRHFCSHRQTPSSGQIVQPGVVKKGRTIYFCHPIFSQYQSKAPRWCKQLFFNALQQLLPDPLVHVNAPTGLIATLNAQPAHKRWVLHLLYYIPERRCDEFDVIEDVVPLYGVQVRVKTGAEVKRVRCVPQGEELPFVPEQDTVSFTVPKVEGHQMVELTFAD